MKRSPCLRYYDMNFYVHQCSRMSYKREYVPSEIACPTHGRWVPLDDVAVAKLDADKYVHNHGDPMLLWLDGRTEQLLVREVAAVYSHPAATDCVSPSLVLASCSLAQVCDPVYGA